LYTNSTLFGMVSGLSRGLFVVVLDLGTTSIG
jgi:hypothetical protein